MKTALARAADTIPADFAPSPVEVAAMRAAGGQDAEWTLRLLEDNLLPALAAHASGDRRAVSARLQTMTAAVLAREPAV